MAEYLDVSPKFFPRKAIVERDLRIDLEILEKNVKNLKKSDFIKLLDVQIEAVADVKKLFLSFVNARNDVFIHVVGLKISDACYTANTKIDDIFEKIGDTEIMLTKDFNDLQTRHRIFAILSAQRTILDKIIVIAEACKSANPPENGMKTLSSLINILESWRLREFVLFVLLQKMK